jgi:hypothetical protein
MNHSDQIQRIRTKLKQAKRADWRRKVFGAESHKYRIGKPVSESEVRAFEERYSLTLPGCYRSFLTGVGNGGPSYQGSAAGPFYGIYPLGDSVDEIINDPALHLKQPAIIEPDMTDEKWATLTQRIKGDDRLSNEDYEKERGRIYAGLLPIGSQGCTYLHALVLNGRYQGRVVNLDCEGQKPRFTFEKNFLDWYERWLDEVIGGDLAQENLTWFGYSMGGNAENLLRVYADADSRKTRLDALRGLAKLATATGASCQKLLALCSDNDAEIRHDALRMLTKFDYVMAREPLRTHISGNDDDCLAACQSIYAYARKQSKEWVDLLRSRLPMVNSPETFRLMSYLLVEAKVDFSEDFKPFCTHENVDIRSNAFFSLGRLKNKKDLVDLFIVGLDDPAARVVHTTLQALKGVRDKKLINAYNRVLDRFKTDEYSVLTNLNLRLKEMGLA